ncbi:universal stress protein [Streptomyces monticola]|uniref:Universal stress protein n=1 Tax=Streptomyces monticola TaxID=2666263 RepID=A0ABW2JUI1_9ACTN
MEVRAVAQQGRPAHALVRAAGEAGLVIVGRRVRRSAVGSHVGRVTHSVLRHVPCSIVVVAHECGTPVPRVCTQEGPAYNCT